MLLKVDELSIEVKEFHKTIVKGNSFCVQEGETLGVVGESGSGKTMTGKAIMGLLNPKIFEVHGHVKFNNSELVGMSERKYRTLRGSQIAMIMQNPMTAFAPMIKIGKQMTDTLVHLGYPKRKLYAISVNALKIFSLPNAEKLMDSYPYELSGGMLQRIMIALTMLLEPKIIIADEATTAVDAVSEQIIIEEFNRIKESGVSLIVITHDFGVAASLCENVIVMKNGEIIERGCTKSVFNSPKHEYTKKLVSASVLFGGVRC